MQIIPHFQKEILLHLQEWFSRDIIKGFYSNRFEDIKNSFTMKNSAVHANNSPWWHKHKNFLQYIINELENDEVRSVIWFIDLLLERGIQECSVKSIIYSK